MVLGTYRTVVIGALVFRGGSDAVAGAKPMHDEFNPQ
jgi:hypothetical protein